MAQIGTLSKHTGVKDLVWSLFQVEDTSLFKFKGRCQQCHPDRETSLVC